MNIEISWKDREGYISTISKCECVHIEGKEKLADLSSILDIYVYISFYMHILLYA